MARSRGRAEPPVVVTDRHARGLVRKFLGDEQQRAAEVRRRRRRQPLRGAPSMRAAHRVLEGLEKDWAPRTLASYTDVSPDGAARLGIACLETDRGWLENWPGVAARSFVRRYLVRPGDTLYRSKWRGYAAFTQHCLERVMQRGLHLKSARWELGVASIIANPRLHELAISRGFKQVLVPGLTGVFVGDFEPELPFLRLDTFLAITAAGRRHCDLMVELAGLLWTGDRYRELMPALFYPDERNTLMDEVLRTYEKHQRLLSRPHEPGEDWFGLAVAQKEDASARLATIHV